MKIIIQQGIRKSSFQVWVTLFFFLVNLSNPLLASLPAMAKPGSHLNPIQRENQMPGTRDWQLTDPAQEDGTVFHYPAIEGYTWASSVEAGNAIKFSVSTTAASFSAAIYRMGWYQGKGGRLIQSIAAIQGNTYPVPAPDPDTGLVQARWPLAFTLQTNAHWVSGMYMVKLTAANGQQSYIPFILRSSQASAYAFIHAVNTDEAYNFWGGTSLYNDFTHAFKAQRAFKVSFDRPFEQDTGAGLFFWFEYPMVRWLEQHGYDVSYLADPDLQNAPTLLQKYHALLVVGHSEYWSKQMLATLENAVNQGINLAVFGANNIYWQIRYEASQNAGSQSLPDRVLVCYKDKALDPLYGKDNSVVTVKFRDDPLNNAEQSLLGSMWAGQWEPRKGSYPWIVADASNWIFAGTGLKNGDSLPGLIGYEYDKVDPTYFMPPGVAILSNSPVVNDINQQKDVSNSTLYTTASGARVFNVGTFEWSWGLDSNFSVEKEWSPGSHAPYPGVVNKAAQKITANILQNFLRTGNTPLASRGSTFDVQKYVPYAIVLLGAFYLVFCYWIWRKVFAHAKRKHNPHKERLI